VTPPAQQRTPGPVRRTAARLPKLTSAIRLAAAAALACLAHAAALAADAQITSLVDNPDPVPAGGVVAYTARVDNNAVDAATNVRLRLTLPAGATFLSATPAGANCAPTSATTIECNLGTVAALGADPRDVTFNWRALGPGPATITATAEVLSDNDSNAANNTQPQTTTVSNGANLALAKSGSPDPVVGGSNLSYTLTVTNAGPNAAGSLRLIDNLPPSVSFVSASGSGWTCGHSAGVVTCDRNGPNPLGTPIPAVTIAGQVNASGGTVTNSATIQPGPTGGVADPDTTDNTATASVTVLPGADVRIAQKSVSSALPAIAGADVTFVIQPRNGGPAAATSVTVTDTLPAGWTFVSASGSGWVCSNAANTVSCTRASLSAGATDDITVLATTPGNLAVGPTGSTYTNTASITATSNDPNAGNNSGSVSVNVLPDGADLRLTKSKNPNPVAQGSPMTSTINVINNGPRTATGPLRVLEQLTGETFVSGSGTGWSCSAAAGLVTCNHANAGGLALNDALPTLTIVTTATASGSVSNQACTGTSTPGAGTASPPAEGDPNPTNDCVTVTSNSTTTRPDLAIAKTTSTPTGGDKTVSNSESSVTYTVVVTNASAAGTEPATGVVIDDTVPGWINGRSSITTPVGVAVSAGTATFGCVVTATTGRVLCTQNGGALTGGQSVTVTIVANRPLQDGSFTNTATVFNTAEGDPNPANNTATDTVTIAPIADVEMTGKSVTPSPVRAGEEATYVLSFRNNGPSTATGVTVADTFTFAPADAGLTVLSLTSSKAGSTCSIAAGAQLTPAAAGFNCTIGSLANGETQSITLIARPNWQAGNAARSFGNLARVNTTSVENPAGGDNGNNERSATLPVQPAAVDLLVNKTDRVGAVNLDPVGFDAGNTFLSYQVGVTNNGPSFASGVTITETLTPPAGRRIRFVCDVTSFGGSTCNPAPLCTGAGSTSAPGTALPTFTCQAPAGTSITGPAVGTLAVGQTKNIFLRFQVLDQPAATGDVYNNTARVAANEPDTQSANDEEGEATTTRQRVDLRASKTASIANPTIWQPFNWVVTAVNNGPGNSLQTDVTDTLPAGAQVTGPITWARTLQPGSGTCTQAGQVVTCGLGQLDAGGSATITIPVRFTTFPAGGPATNSATIDTDPIKTGGIDTPGGNNTGTNTVTVTRSSIAGTVFEDRDRAGPNAGTPQAAGTEPRIAGVQLRLTGTDAYGNAVDRTATTDANGNYVIDNLAPSNGAGYTLTQTQPGGFANGPAAPPTSGVGSPSNGGTYAAGASPTAPSTYTGVVLPAITAATNYSFPEVRAPSLSGFVYIDANGNNTRNPGTDPPIAGATVRLLNATTGALVATATTDGSGAYSFTSLDPFTPYTLEQPLPTSAPNLVNGVVNPGLIGGAACASGCTAQPDTPAADTDRIAAIDLSSTNDGTQFNFGERQVAVIAGTVYSDRNTNNLLDPGTTDGRLAGVTLTLRQGTDCTGPVLDTTATAADGTYAFRNTTSGLTYTVCQVQPAGFADGATNPGTNGTSAAANAITITNLPTAGSAANNFGERAGSLAGTVYLDTNNNGAQGAGEAGISGVTLTLSGNSVTGAAITRTTTTDASGNWRFDDLPAAGPGGYTVTEQAAQPVVAGTSTLNGRTTAGPGGGTATAVAATPSAIAAIPLAAGATSTGHLFGELLPATISGTVFLDTNNDGTQQPPADTGLAGVTITLTGTDDTGAPATRTVTTGADGRYSFGDLRPGTYTLTQPTQPPGTSNGITTAGSAGGTASGPGVAPSAITAIVLATGGATSIANNFAEIPANSALEGRVWLDADNNGAPGATEAGIAGVTIELTGTDAAGNAVNRTATTSADGRYGFAQLAPGTYTVREPAQPAGTVNGATLPGNINGTAAGTASPVATVPSAISGVTLAANQTSRDNNFGEVPAAAITGRVYADNNNNGQPDAGEAGLAGVTLVLTGTDDLGRPVNLTVTTGADGSYSFGDLRPGTYTVTQPTQPAGTLNGITSPGSAGGSASPPTQPVSTLTGIVLGPGTQALANNFGELVFSPDLRVSKAALAEPWTVGRTGTYRLSVRNVGELPTTGAYTVSDRLPAGMTLAATPAGAGWVCNGAAGDAAFSCSNSTVVAAGAALPATIDATVTLGPNAALVPPNNRVLVEGGGEIAARGPSAAERNGFDGPDPLALPACTPTLDHNACRTPTRVQLPGALAGTVWLDTGSNGRLLDGGDRRLPGWVVEVLDATGAVAGSAVSAADGSYRIEGLLPGVPYTVRFREPGTNVVFGFPVNGEQALNSSGVLCDATAAQAGRASSCVGSGADPLLSVVLAPGQTLTQQSLPVDPSGIVYDSGLRQAVPGATVTLAPQGVCAGWNPATAIVAATLGGYSIAGSSISVTVGADGFYQFLFSPAAPPNCTFTLSVTAPTGYAPPPSGAIPPAPGPLTPPGGAGSTFPVQPQAGPPTAPPGPATLYYLTFNGGSAGANIIHNHIPLDPLLPTSLSLVKTGDRRVAELGDSVRYTLTVNAPAGPRPRQTTVIDRLPAGFTYIRGTASVNDQPLADPTGGVGPTLVFNLGPMPANSGLVLRYRVRVGVGAQQGDGINRAQSYACGTPAGCTGAAFLPQPAHVASNAAAYQVRVTGGVFGTEACVLGKIFVDCNNNHVQDREELGIPGVRLVMSDGTTLVSDSEGKYSVCGVTPRSHVLKPDPLTLPRGSRLTTSSNRNLGDAASLWLDVKNGELHRADFIEGSCSNTVLEQVKARRAQGEVRAPEPEKKGGPALRFDSKAHGKSTLTSPQQGTDGANQRAPKPRAPTAAASGAGGPKDPAQDETNVPTPALPMNRPAPKGRDSGTAPDAPARGASGNDGGSDGGKK
jgi:uncharacterized repeat protein (TIGR01451 family)